MTLKLTDQEIDAARSPKGGFTRKTLAGWGVPWPPPHGWRKALLQGDPIPRTGLGTAPPKDDPSPIRSDITAHELLRTVVMAVINHGHASDLYEFPDVLAYFGAQIPTDEELAKAGMKRTASGGAISANGPVEVAVPVKRPPSIEALVQIAARDPKPGKKGTIECPRCGGRFEWWKEAVIGKLSGGCSTCGLRLPRA